MAAYDGSTGRDCTLDPVMSKTSDPKSAIKSSYGSSATPVVDAA
eukprot:CAMPEP_0175083956 /NCGR_PEP_ID=MMETSP0052_2-20121109/27724_1 /TAXON_ID=51329 ORGANISM="Polytomella parva, Strain SAG 63-3" /NCGR_SAMPLE_ID=MMETSP0052_2 /ASSEMBLY_ACC=CAM_ASM_000194 /LENGTH=43 /DNA_ID= /DNA_START= /DNA_END= /DNA_ORIENTATION=